MEKLVRPSEISGTIKAPSSKSMMQRAVAAAVLSKGSTRITNVTFSNDTRAALRVAEALGAKVKIEEDTVLIDGGFKPTGDVLNCGESGLGFRMFTAIAALHNRELTITGEGSLLNRPVTMVEKPLKKLGVKVKTTRGFPPIRIKGPLKAGKAKVDGSVTSQFLTGLLMALPMVEGKSRLKVKQLRSNPYIDMTMALQGDFGVRMQHTDYELFFIDGPQQYAAGEYQVEGDWSGAAFPLVAGALGGSVTVTGLDTVSTQADRRILIALKACGAKIKMTEESVSITKAGLKAFDFDATNCPDLFPPVAALACNCEGTSVIHGTKRLIHKESNRAMTLEKEFTKLGAKIRLQDNRMEIEGGPLQGGVIDSHNDHRIAMAGALAAINASGPVTINDAGCAAKSYPGFFEDFIAIGGQVDE